MKDYNWTDTLTVAHAAAHAIGGSMEQVDVTVDTGAAHVRLSSPHEADVWVEIQLCPRHEWWQLSGPVVLFPVAKRDPETAGHVAGSLMRPYLLDMTEEGEAERVMREHIRNAEHRLIDPSLTDTP